jgi:hypothetical protein
MPGATSNQAYVGNAQQLERYKELRTAGQLTNDNMIASEVSDMSGGAGGGGWGAWGGGAALD